MAAAAAAALLDELMGRDRNLAPTEKKKEIRWEDPAVCKHFLVKFCPNELFVNTRADLGPCEKIHDEVLKNEYEKSHGYQKMGYEEDFLRFCQSMMADVERRIRRGKQRLSQGNQEGGLPAPTQVRNNDEKIQMLTERINGLLEQVEQLGCDGKVEEAQGIMKLCDQLKEEREGLRRVNENSHWLQTAEIAAAQEKQMEVCEVCGAFLIVGDAQQRVDDHLMGKQHMGFAKIKTTVDEMLTKRQKEREEREERREKEREERRRAREEEDKQREREREERKRQLDEEKKRDRDRERSHKRNRSRSRERKLSHSRSRRHSRSHSRDRRRSSSHGKERTRRSRSRERTRNHEHKKSHRSRSRSPHNRRDHIRDGHRDNKRSSAGHDENDKYMRNLMMVENKIIQEDVFSEPMIPTVDWPSPEERTEPENPVVEESSPKSEPSSCNDPTAKWQVSGWTEIRSQAANTNGAKSEGDSEQ